MKKLTISLFLQTMLTLTTISCGHGRNGVGNYEEAKALQKMVRERNLTDTKVNEVFSYEGSNISLAKTIVAAEKDKADEKNKNQEVADLTIKVTTNFEPKNMIEQSCLVASIVARDLQHISKERFEEKNLKCLDYVQKVVDWEKIKPNQEKAVSTLKDCESMNMGQISDCFVLFNDFFMAIQEKASCSLSTEAELENFVIEKLRKNHDNPFSKIKECRISMEKCQINSTLKGLREKDKMSEELNGLKDDLDEPKENPFGGK